MQQWRAPWLLVLLAAAFLASPFQPTRADAQTLYGFHQDLDYFGTSSQPRINAVASIGAQASRSTLLWRDHEPSPGVFDWTKSDFVHTGVQQAGIANVWYIGCSPSWANGSSDCWTVPSYPSAAFNTWRDRVASFAAAAAARYPGQMWEVWNEPNEFHFWKPQPNRAAYSELYRAVRTAILNADSTAKVAVGGITSINVGCGPPQCIDGYDFIEGMLQNGDPIDFMGIHAYDGQAQGPQNCVAGERSFRDIALVRVLLNSFGLNNVPIWVTEWGWPDSIGQSTQAQFLTQAHQMLASGTMTTCPEHGSQTVQINVTVSNWFFDIDTPNFQGWGVFDVSFQPKPAATAFSSFIDSLPDGEQILDELSDWSKVFARSSGTALDSTNPQLFQGDTSRAFRTTGGGQWLVWRLDGMDSFEAEVFFWPAEPVVHFQIQTSPDASSWTTMSPTITGGSGNWIKYTYTLTGLSNANYINMVWQNPGQVWAPQISRVTITAGTP